MTLLRWPLVPVVAVACVLLATLAANVLAFFMKGAEDQGWLVFIQTTTVQRLAQALLIPLAFIWGGSRVAPAHRAKVGELLFVVALLYTGAITFSGLFYAREAGPIEIGAQAIFSVAGAYWGLSEVRLSIAKNLKGWPGVFPPFMTGDSETSRT